MREAAGNLVVPGLASPHKRPAPPIFNKAVCSPFSHWYTILHQSIESKGSLGKHHVSDEAKYNWIQDGYLCRHGTSRSYNWWRTGKRNI
jgi:hypothetical protein